MPILTQGSGGQATLNPGGQSTDTRGEIPADRPNQLDVAIVGAGPFGLSLASFLRDRACRVFGDPMHTWRTVMPRDMELRSTWYETSLASPGDRGSIDVWADEVGEPHTEPIALESFLRYGDWFRERWVGDSDPADIELIEPAQEGYRLTTTAGEEFAARRVVLAIGALRFSHAPGSLAGTVDGESVIYATDRVDDPTVAGKRVTIVGAGQTALESASILLRDGASVEIIVRSSVHWFADREAMAERGPVGEWFYKLAYPVVGFGPPPLNRFAGQPDLFSKLPAGLRKRLNQRLLRSGGSPWLREQVEGKAVLTEGRQVVGIERNGNGLHVLLDDGAVRETDRVLLATGYRFSLEALPFLSPEFRSRIRVENGWPALDRYFRSTSEPGISFVGYPAEGRFGPMSRFVVGTRFASPRVYESFSERSK
jgi:pyridine nucleotide-disulfide oxidoreductase